MGFDVRVGDIWVENDNRFTRYFKVIAISSYTDTCTVVTVDMEGNKVGRVSHPRLRRFNGKHQGYSLVSREA